jgi:hypothetical protein
MNNENNAPLIAALVIVSLVAFPAIYMLMKDKPAPVAPAVVAPPPPTIIEKKEIIIQQAPAPRPPAPPICTPAEMYNRGWNDARRRIDPLPDCRHNPDYIRGYRDYCRRYRPGFILNIDIK